MKYDFFLPLEKVFLDVRVEIAENFTWWNYNQINLCYWGIRQSLLLLPFTERITCLFQLIDWLIFTQLVFIGMQVDCPVKVCSHTPDHFDKIGFIFTIAKYKQKLFSISKCFANRTLWSLRKSTWFHINTINYTVLSARVNFLL